MRSSDDDDGDLLIDFLKEFEVKQRRGCLEKAETMMEELKPQFEHFLKVFCKSEHLKTICVYNKEHKNAGRNFTAINIPLKLLICTPSLLIWFPLY